MVEFFSNLFLQLFSGRLPGYAGTYLQWLPSFWFLGVYEKVIGIAKPAMTEMAHRAFIALAAAIVRDVRKLRALLPASFLAAGGIV